MGYEVCRKKKTQKKVSKIKTVKVVQGSGIMYLMWWKQKTSNQDYFTQQGSGSDLKENSKAS